MKVSTFTTTFDELLGHSFRRLNAPEDGIVKIEVCVSSLVGNALNRFLDYCSKYGYKHGVEEIKDNLILLTVHLK